jgi:hypothetical protein
MAVICLAAVTAVVVLTTARAGEGVPAINDAEIEQVLALAGGNRAELATALEHFPPESIAIEAMRFLVAGLPLADLGTVSADYLIENVALALTARNEMPYGRSYSDAVWAHYVLPHRVSQEPLEPWREHFHRNIAGLVKDCQSIEEAIPIAYGWVGEQVRFEQTQRRDQGPLTTLKGGTGRCEELMIVYIDALRSVGIPARNTFCPWWSHCDNNHAWTEVYLDDGHWYCDEVVGQEDRRGGWVMAAARQASVVVNMCYGAAENPGAQLLRGSREPGARYTMLNSIGEYRDASTVELDFTGLLPDGSNTDAAGEECRVYIHVWNYGAMRPVSYVYIDEDLRARFAVGAGTYTLSTDAAVDTPVVVCRITLGEELSFRWEELPPAGDCMFAEYPRD